MVPFALRLQCTPQTSQGHFCPCPRSLTTSLCYPCPVTLITRPLLPLSQYPCRPLCCPFQSTPTGLLLPPAQAPSPASCYTCPITLMTIFLLPLSNHPHAQALVAPFPASHQGSTAGEKNTPNKTDTCSVCVFSYKCVHFLKCCMFIKYCIFREFFIVFPS